MKTIPWALATAALAVACLISWAPAQAPAPTGSLPPGPTSLSGSIGITVYNNIVYLVREGAVSKIDATTIPPGHMMTLDGRLEPLPPGIKLPGAEIPEADENRPRPRAAAAQTESP